MICPKGEPVHLNLSSEYTDVPQLLSTLGAEKFSGTVEVRSSNKRGIFFLSLGETIDATAGSDSDPIAVTGEEAIEELLVICTKPDATIGVYKLTAQEAEFAVSTLQSEIVFKGLSTDFVRLDRFLKKLADEKHFGFIEIFSKENRTAGVIALKNGQADLLIIMTGSGTPSFSGPGMIPDFLEHIGKQSMLFNLHRTTPSRHQKDTPIVPADTPVIQKQAEQAVKTEPSVLNKETERVPEETNERHDPPAIETTVKGEPEQRSQFLSDLQAILFKVEKFVAGLAENGSFQRAFKRACVEKSEVYPFLDPFEGLFDYSGGQLRVDDQVTTETFAAGAAECLNLTLTYLQRELPKKCVLPVGLKGDIESSFREHQLMLAKSGIQDIIPASFQ